MVVGEFRGGKMQVVYGFAWTAEDRYSAIRGLSSIRLIDNSVFSGEGEG